MHVNHDAEVDSVRGNAALILSPYVGREGYRATLIKHYCILGTERAANPAAVAPPRIYDYLLVGDAESHGPELAKPHALPAAVARLGFDFSNILRAEHDRESHDGGPYRRAVRVAVADASDEGGVECPKGVAEAILLQFPKTGHSLVFGESL